jgi:hypothetical protein
MNWNSILNWRLLVGSHKFPGPDGGTCINEAAIVAAGFEYREIKSADDCPVCFSRVIAGYALRLNDVMDNDLRQELLTPYVVRLAGTADMREIEVKRAIHIAVQTVRRILPISLRAIGLEKEALQCERVETAAADAAAKAANAAAKGANGAAYGACAHAAHAADAANPTAYAAYAADAAYAAANAAYAAANDDAARKQIFLIAVAILDEAIRLGKQAEPIETKLVASRMDAIKQRAVAC